MRGQKKRKRAEAAKRQVAANKDRIAELDQRREVEERKLTALVIAIQTFLTHPFAYSRMTPIAQRFRKWESQLSLILSQKHTGILAGLA